MIIAKKLDEKQELNEAVGVERSLKYKTLVQTNSTLASLVKMVKASKFYYISEAVVYAPGESGDVKLTPINGNIRAAPDAYKTSHHKEWDISTAGTILNLSEFDAVATYSKALSELIKKINTLDLSKLPTYEEWKI